MYRLNKLMIFISLILFSFTSRVNALVKPTTEFYVNDYANILSEETEKYIIEKSKMLDNANGTQIVVVTVKNLEGMPIEVYSLSLARNFKIGDYKNNNGLLLLLALEERQFRVEVGYGLEGILNDAKTGRFQDDYIIPYLKENKWDEGIKNGYDAFYKEIVKENNLSLNYTEPVNENVETDSTTFFPIIFMGFIIGFVIGTIKANKIILFYIIIWIILFLTLQNYIVLLIGNIIMFFVGLLVAKAHKGNLYGNYMIGNSSIGSRTIRRGGNSGGGGSFGGGGSSRKF